MSAFSRSWQVAPLALGLMAASSAFAGMGNLGTTYGLMPTDIASAQALSMFNTQVSATYYNPAYLAKDPRGELNLGLLHAEQELRAARNNPDVTGDVIQSKPSQHVLIGMKTNLTSLTRLNHPLHLGVAIGVEKYGQEMLSFSSQSTEDGQFLEYGREPLFLAVGGATRFWRGISGGASARVTLHAEATLNATSNLAGETRREQIGVSAKPVLKGIVSLNVDYGETFCPDQACWMTGLETAFAYRARSNTKTTVDANVIVEPGIIEDGLPLAITTIDSFQPEVFSAGVHYRRDNWRVAASAELQRWSVLSKVFEGDTVKNQAGVPAAERIQFDDIIVPRIGGEIELFEFFSFTGGLAFEPSPLKSTQSPELNYFDTDRYVVGVGVSATYPRTRYLSFPVRMDLGYQYHYLKERDFTLTQFDGTTENVTADGDVHVVAGSITLKF